MRVRFPSVVSSTNKTVVWKMGPHSLFFIFIEDGEASSWTGVSGLPERGFDPHLSPPPTKNIFISELVQIFSFYGIIRT